MPRITCLLITLLSLIPIMLGAGLCSDSVTGMTAGLVLIRNDQRPGYKHTQSHTRTHTSIKSSRPLTQTGTCTSPSPQLAVVFWQQHSVICKPDCFRQPLSTSTIRRCHLWLHSFVSSKQEPTAWRTLQTIRFKALIANLYNYCWGMRLCAPYAVMRDCDSIKMTG